MERKQFKLWENATPFYNESYGQPEPTLTWYPAEAEEPRGCVIVFPGGGYGMRVEHEGKAISEMLNKHGFHSFVLNYRIAPYKHPAPLEDALRAVRFVRYYADSFGILKNKIAVMGFSAGGHLAVTAAEKFDYGKSEGDEIDRQSSRPDAAVFCYSMCTLLGEYKNKITVKNLLGTDEPTDIAYNLSGELNARGDMPPCFIWHTFGDTVVPVQNSLMLADALRKKNVPLEMHLFPDGPHGLGLAEKIPHTAQWVPLLCRWLKYLQF